MLFVIIIHAVGLVGLSSPWRDQFVQLTSINLFLTAAVVFEEVWKRNLKSFQVLALLFALGLGIEITGVQTGFPFGEYSYGTVMGPKIAGVSVSIGLNWYYLIVCAVGVVRLFSKSTLVAVLLAPVILTLFDFLIEPVAITLEYWSWAEVSVPFTNYLAWYLVSIPMVYIYLRWTNDPPVKFPAQVLLLQAVFFVVLNTLM